MIPSLAGSTIESIRSDYALKIWTSDNWEILLAGDTTMIGPDGHAVEVDTEAAQDEPIAEVRPLLGQRISEVAIDPDGALRLEVEGIRLVTRVGDDHEAWQVSGPKGEKFICMPGGELAVWGPLPD